MKIAVIGTGVVGQSLAGRLAEVGHAVTVGTRDVAATQARTEPDAMGNPPTASGLMRTRRCSWPPSPTPPREPS
jgi:3-hydroxyisobutyrate dehydrogenase-like beta-hydroxyacid dehydrogenase